MLFAIKLFGFLTFKGGMKEHDPSTNTAIINQFRKHRNTT